MRAVRSSRARFRTGDRDFTPQLSRIKEVKPDVIYAPIYYTELALMAKQAKEMGLNAPIVAGDGVQAPELIELGGNAVEGVYFSAHFHEDMVETERGKKFLELFKKETGKELDSFGAMGADVHFVLIDAIRRVVLLMHRRYGNVLSKRKTSKVCLDASHSRKTETR